MDNKPRILHLCDFDGTLTRGDTLWHFLKFAAGPVAWLRAMVLVPASFMGLWVGGKWSNDRAKEKLLAIFFKSRTKQEMEAAGMAFYRNRLPALLRQALLQQLLDAVKRGDQVVVVSASLDIWLKPFCHSYGFDCLCTELEFNENGTSPSTMPRFTGRFAVPNCNRKEKERRIKAAYQLGQFDRIIAYGNSNGDEAMFALAHEVVHF
ncbi:MAG: haloacid dehalogenase-like hydrolase [Saprospiraceae bacterium]|nr:haloacid dehalogenase-like hydrolase [Saprospiraceae bacterium]